MCDQTEIDYLDGEVVWVKLGSCWWPGEVVAPDKLPPDVMPSFRKPPIAVVKFFQEDTYEYVKNISHIYKYNCSRKNEFIKKGLDMYRSKHAHMEKFPEDVVRAETVTEGDKDILIRDEFQEMKKESYAGIFGDTTKKCSPLGKKGKNAKLKHLESSMIQSPQRRQVSRGNSNYQVHILVQGSKSGSNQSIDSQLSSSVSPSSSSQEPENISENVQSPGMSARPATTIAPAMTTTTTPATTTERTTITAMATTPSILKPESSTSFSSPGTYSCHACPFTTSRLNVMILHNKTHSITYTPYTPSPISKISPKPIIKQISKNTTPKSSKPKRPRKETQLAGKKKKNNRSIKRTAGQSSPAPIKKFKTDEEIKSSLLADWDDFEDDCAEESSSISVSDSPQIPTATESPEIPTSADSTITTPSISENIPLNDRKSVEAINLEKADALNDSAFDFKEDEDWPLETDIGRKIPRVKNALKRKIDTQKLKIDEDIVAKEVAELLQKTKMPELPSVPEGLKAQENFPEPTNAKSPDKNVEQTLEIKPSEVSSSDAPPPKTIFKTKTFFRSRHSRSQDVIGKYVAEQLNAAEKLDASDSDLNGTENVPSPESRDSPPVDCIKIARLAPKIQLKKMKAEAQLKEKGNMEFRDMFVHKSNSSEDIENKKESIISTSANIISDINKIPEAKLEGETDDFLSCATMDIPKPNEENINLSKSCIDVVESEKLTNRAKSEENLSYHKNTIDVIEPENIEKIEHESCKHIVEPLMNETVASAVDALLSVSREADHVTKTISNDPPENLFEDDNVIPEQSNGLTILKTDDILSNELLHNDSSENIAIQNEQVQMQDAEKPIDVNSNSNYKDEQTGNENVLELNDKVIEEKSDFLDITSQSTVESIPSESDLQIAETLINLPATTLQTPIESKHDHKDNLGENQNDIINKCNATTLPESINDLPIVDTSDNKVQIDTNFNNIQPETELELSENFNAAQSLVQMSESLDHKLSNIDDTKFVNDTNPVQSTENMASNENKTDFNIGAHNVKYVADKIKNSTKIVNSINIGTNSSKLLQILEEPCHSKVQKSALKSPTKPVIIQSKEKILNFDVNNSTNKVGSSLQQKIVIRRTTAKTLINKLGESPQDKIILSRSTKPQDGSSVPTYTIEPSPDLGSDSGNTIIIQQKLRKIVKSPPKLQKLLDQKSTFSSATSHKSINQKNAEDSLFDINSMPIVLSDEILTPENIDKMPIVMADGKIVTNTQKVTKVKQPAESEHMFVNNPSTKSEIKTVVVNSSGAEKSSTPNILSKSAKLRGIKQMVVIDKSVGKQKIITPKTETINKEPKITQSKTTIMAQPSGTNEKFILLPAVNVPRQARTQKIVIHPQSGKTRVMLSKGPEPLPSSKPVSAKIIPNATDAGNAGGTVMIITNAQGGQSRIVLTPEHEKLLFPNKQHSNVSQKMAQIKPSVANTSVIKPQTIVTTIQQPLVTKAPTRIISKQKNAIITSKGQLILSNRITSTVTTSSPTLSEIRPTITKRLVTPDTSKVLQTVHKTTPNEPLIFLQQKSGAVMQLTTAQFEHLQRTGQIIQKTPLQVQAIVQESKAVPQKITAIESSVPAIQKQRTREIRPAVDSPTQSKKMKTVEIAPARPPQKATLPPLAPLPPAVPPAVVTATPISCAALSSTNSYPDLENFEELLPSTAIARQPEPTVQLEPPPPAQLSDGQILAVPGEHFGGPPGCFYLCVEDNNTLTPIDSRPLVLENNQLVPMAVETVPVMSAQPERRDILEAALANSDVFQAEAPRDEAPDFRDLNANVSVHCRVSETSTTLNQPIMTPVEMPSNVDSEPVVPANLEDGLAVIGVTPKTVPTSLELPITVTDPRIAPKTVDPLCSTTFATTILSSPSSDIYISSEAHEVPSASISMPLLTEEDDGVGKSMPILTDEVNDRNASSVESTIGSPSSIDVRESEIEDGVNWSRRLLTPGSDSSETSSEIPLQPALELSVSDLSHS